MRHATRPLAPLVLAALSPAALADESTPWQPEERWSLLAEPSVHYAAPSGKLTLPGGTSTRVEVRDLNMDSPKLSATGELTLRYAHWGVTTRGLAFSAEQQPFTPATPLSLGTLTIGAGQDAVSSLKFEDYEIEGFRRWRLLERGTGDLADVSVRAFVDTIAGVRYTRADWQFDLADASASVRSDEEFLTAHAGARLVLNFYERTQVDFTLTLGGLPGSREAITWDTIVGFQYNPTENFGIQIGYRQLAFFLEDADTAYQWRGALAGLSFGLVFKF